MTMYLQSILIVGGNEKMQQTKLAEILTSLGFPNTPNLSNNPNILALSPDAEKLSLGIEAIRQLRSALPLKPATTLPKVAIIHMADTLTEEAQNALLKTLEEPPDNTYLVLFARTADALLPTVVSRCQLVELSENFTVDVATEELPKLSPVLDWMEEGNVARGFAWAKDAPERKTAITLVDTMLIAGRKLLLAGKTSPKTIRQLFEAKKYLLAGTSVRLTLENLFL